MPAQHSGIFPFIAQSSCSFSHSFVPGTLHIPSLPPKPTAIPVAPQLPQASPRLPLPAPSAGLLARTKPSGAGFGDSLFNFTAGGVVRTVRRELPRIRRAAMNLGQSRENKGALQPSGRWVRGVGKKKKKVLFFRMPLTPIPCSL